MKEAASGCFVRLAYFFGRGVRGDTRISNNATVVALTAAPGPRAALARNNSVRHRQVGPGLAIASRISNHY